MPISRIYTKALLALAAGLTTVVGRLEARNVRCTEIEEAPWGVRTTIPLPSGGEVGLYQPAHPTALGLDAGPAAV